MDAADADFDSNKNQMNENHFFSKYRGLSLGAELFHHVKGPRRQFLRSEGGNSSNLANFSRSSGVIYSSVRAFVDDSAMKIL